MSSKYVRVQALVPREWYSAVKKIIEKESYVFVSEYVRDLIKRSIEAEGDG